MKNQDGPQRARPVIVDVSHLNPSSKRGNRRRRGQHVRDNRHEVDEFEQWPIEALPVLRATLEYGRRTHALGAMQGAYALKQIADRIRALGTPTPALEQIMLDAEGKSAELRQLLSEVYEDD